MFLRNLKKTRSKLAQEGLILALFLVLTCSPADPRPVHRLHSLVPAIHWAHTGWSAVCCRTTDPTDCMAVLESSRCSAEIWKSISGCRVSKYWGNCIQGYPGAHLWHLHLLNRADHVCSFFAPVTLNNIAFYGCAIDRYNGMSSCFVRIEPVNRKKKKLNCLIAVILHILYTRFIGDTWASPSTNTVTAE